MKIEVALVILIVGVIVVSIIAGRRRGAWPGALQRLHPGVAQRAEWMAPDDIVRGVEADYLAAQRWMVEASMAGYARFLSEAPDHFAGSYLKRQQKIVSLLMQGGKPRVRFIGILQAQHELHVRHFSDDGLSCYLLDGQTARKMITYEYWHARCVTSQSLLAGTYVYRMIYDRAARRWKIEDLIQQLPLGWDARNVSNAPIRLDESLPSVQGRDI